MRIFAYRRLGDPQPIVAEDIMVLRMDLDDGTAAFVSCQHEPRGGLDGVTLAHANESDFNQVLRALGFGKLTVCSSLDDLKSSPNELERLPLLLSNKG